MHRRHSARIFDKAPSRVYHPTAMAIPWLFALLIWTILTWGFSYTLTRAELFEKTRVTITMYLPFMAGLFACRACVHFWTGQAAAYIVMAHLPVPWYAWIYAPQVAGFCAVGLVDLMAFVRRGGDPNV